MLGVSGSCGRLLCQQGQTGRQGWRCLLCPCRQACLPQQTGTAQMGRAMTVAAIAAVRAMMMTMTALQPLLSQQLQGRTTSWLLPSHAGGMELRGYTGKSGGYGYIVWDADKQSFGAHCSLTACHGKLCRANKIAKRLPLGYLVAWLMLPHEDTEISDRPKHKDAQRRLCLELGYDQRRRGRTWLTDRSHSFADMLDLEKPHHRGPMEEPLRVVQ